jgi:hypothetical protein
MRSPNGDRAIRANLRCFGSATASQSITPPKLDALREHLFEKPDQYLDEMAVFFWDEFSALVPTATISRTLKAIGWSKKAARRVAKEQNPDLRDFYLHNLSAFRSCHLVFVDESGCDKREGFRRTGWNSSVQVTQAVIQII